jgi:hypothetical protein
MSTTKNLVSVIYEKYPCIEQIARKNNLVLATFSDAVVYLLKSFPWKQFLMAKLPADSPYREDLRQYGFIMPELSKSLSRIPAIIEKMKTLHSPIFSNKFTPEETIDINVMAKFWGIKGIQMPRRSARRAPRPIKVDRIVLNFLQKFETTASYQPSIAGVLHDNRNIRGLFREFLHMYFVQLCDPIRITGFQQRIADAVRIWSGASEEPTKAVGAGYITDIVDDNLAETFPKLYLDNEEKRRNPGPSPSFPLQGFLPWDNRPLFPQSGMVLILSQDTRELLSFVAAARGQDTNPGTPDYDVHGQLVCSSSRARGGGVAKLIMLSTVLMLKEYRVNYIFIQAMLGVIEVQGSLYSRIGFNMYFSNELIHRKTAFMEYGGTMGVLAPPRRPGGPQVPMPFSELWVKFLRKDPYVLSQINSREQQMARTLSLKPMWLNVRYYDNNIQSVCSILTVKGYDYHKSRPTDLRSTVGKLFNIGARMAGFRERGVRGVIDPELAGARAEPIHEEEMPDARQPDGSECKSDNECLSDNCYGNRCLPYDFSREPPSFVAGHAEEMAQRRIDEGVRQEVIAKHKAKKSKRQRQQEYQLEQQRNPIEQERRRVQQRLHEQAIQQRIKEQQNLGTFGRLRSALGTAWWGVQTGAGASAPAGASASFSFDAGSEKILHKSIRRYIPVIAKDLVKKSKKDAQWLGSFDVSRLHHGLEKAQKNTVVFMAGFSGYMLPFILYRKQKRMKTFVVKGRRSVLAGKIMENVKERVRIVEGHSVSLRMEYLVYRDKYRVNYVALWHLFWIANALVGRGVKTWPKNSKKLVRCIRRFTLWVIRRFKRLKIVNRNIIRIIKKKYKLKTPEKGDPLICY